MYNKSVSKLGFWSKLNKRVASGGRPARKINGH